MSHSSFNCGKIELADCTQLIDLTTKGPADINAGPIFEPTKAESFSKASYVIQLCDTIKVESEHGHA